MGNSDSAKNSSENKQPTHQKVEMEPKKVTINGNSELLKTNIPELFTKHLPKQFQHKDWNLIYSTKEKGKNIQLFDQCVHGMGANIIFIKSTASDHIFGAFVSQGWEPSADFYGDSATFLFSYLNGDKLYTYKPASYNKNFQYFNYGSKYNKYNGIGIGGLMKYFQLSIDEEFHYGKTMPKLMTFPDCPTLCHVSSASDSPLDDVEQNFEVETIEVFSFPLTKEQITNLEYEKQNKDAKLEGIDENINNFLMTSAGLKKDEAREDAF